MKKTLFILICTTLFTSCESDLEEHLNYFVIRKGEHYTTGRHVEFLTSKTLQFDARFDDSAIYLFDDSGFQDSKNKLMGFSDCNSQHHENSARFAWQWFNNRIEIYAYCYRKGLREEAFVGSVMPGEMAHYEIELTDHAYLFRFKEQETVMQREITSTVGAYLILWPYFGGQQPAPHDVSIYVKRF